MPECANPLLLEWVGEWLETARERNSEGITTFKHAYDSLKACPMTFNHPSECQQLRGFGPKLCQRLRDKLKEHCEANGLPMPKPTRKKKVSPQDDEDVQGPTKKRKVNKAYVPKLRSGAYALVLALSTLREDEEVHKERLMELAQPYCDSSFSAPSDPGKFYTAWNSMKILTEKDLVSEKGRPSKKYSLTDEGWDVAGRIKKSSDPSQGRLDIFVGRESISPQKRGHTLADSDSPTRHQRDRPPKPSDVDLVPQGEPISSTDSLPRFTPSLLKPGMFTVELVLDVREIRAKQDRDYMQNELAKNGMTPIMRTLELGDVLWVAKVKSPDYLACIGGEQGDEIMLDYIVERKRLDDLIGSIKDGRFHEQKFRLKKSLVKNVIYIIEEISMTSDSFTKYEEAVQTAIAATQVVNGFFVKKTQKIDDTIRYLTRMTLMLKELYEGKELRFFPTNVLTARNYPLLLDHLRAKVPFTDYHITYKAFASLSSKSELDTLKNVFLKMLMCTKGVTGEKALEIQKKWKTPKAFLEAYVNCGSGEEGKNRKAEMVSNELSGLMNSKKIAKVLSVKIAEVWGDIEV